MNNLSTHYWNKAMSRTCFKILKKEKGGGEGHMEGVSETRLAKMLIIIETGW